MMPGLVLPSVLTRYSGMSSASWPSCTWVRNSHLLPCIVTFALVAPTRNGVSDLVTTSVCANTCGLIIDPRITRGLPSRMRFIEFGAVACLGTEQRQIAGKCGGQTERDRRRTACCVCLRVGSDGHR